MFPLIRQIWLLFPLVLAVVPCTGPALAGCQRERQDPQGSESAPQERIIHLELAADVNGELGMQQEWMEALERVGLDRVRIITTRMVGGPSVEEIQAGGVVTVKLKGVISGQKIRLPGREFSMRDLAGIREYAGQLRADGAAVTLAEKKGFGLTSDQLVDLHSGLSGVVVASTRGKPAAAVVAELRESLRVPLVVPPEVQRLLEEEREPVRDEFSGLSAGTALAAAVRPLGLVAVPRRPQGGPVEMTLLPSDQAAEHWPVGWPTEGPTDRVEPRLYERIDVEIRDFRLFDALQAVAGRIEIPVLFDHNSLARKEIDPATALVSFVKPRQTHYAIVTKLCSQTRPSLAVDLRVDENGKPFFWIY